MRFSPETRMRLIRWLMRPLFNQGPWHEAHAVEVFRTVRKCWAEEFTEDNKRAQNAHLTELWHKSRNMD